MSPEQFRDKVEGEAILDGPETAEQLASYVFDCLVCGGATAASRVLRERANELEAVAKQFRRLAEFAMAEFSYAEQEL